MRKKYLSALLFGALLFASAGTFTSCKDYDDDINNLQSQITANADAIKALQDLVNNGDYVTKVAKNADGNLVFTFSKSGDQIIELDAEQVGDVLSINTETGELIKNGESTGWFATKNIEDKNCIKIGADGCWQLLQDDGTYKSTNIPVSGVTAAQNTETKQWTLTIVDAQGNSQQVVVPSAASVMSDLELMGWINNTSIDENNNLPQNGIFNTGLIVNYRHIGKIKKNYGDKKETTWSAQKVVVKNQVLTTLAANGVQLVSRVAPADLDLSSMEFTLQDSKGNILPIGLNASTNFNGTLTASRATNSSINLIALDVTDDTYNSEDEYTKLFKGNALYSLVETSGARSTYGGFTITPIKLEDNYLVDVTVTGVYPEGKTTTTTTGDGTTANSPFIVDLNTPTVFLFNDASTSNQVYDYYVEPADEQAAKEFGFSTDKKNGTITLTKSIDLVSKAALKLNVYALRIDGKIYMNEVWVKPSSIMSTAVTLKAGEQNITPILKDGNFDATYTNKTFFTVSLDELFNSMSQTDKDRWMSSVTGATGGATISNVKDAAGKSYTGTISAAFINAKGEVVDNTKATALRLEVEYANADDKAILTPFTEYSMTVSFIHNETESATSQTTVLNTAKLTVTPTLPKLSDYLVKRTGMWNENVLMAYFDDPAQAPVSGDLTVDSKYLASTYNMNNGFTAVGAKTKKDEAILDVNFNVDSEQKLSDDKLAKNCVTLSNTGLNQNTITLNWDEAKDGKPRAYGQALNIQVNAKYLGVYNYSDYATTQTQLKDAAYQIKVQSALEAGTIVPTEGNTIVLTPSGAAKTMQITEADIIGYTYNRDASYSLFQHMSSKTATPDWAYTYIKDVKFESLDKVLYNVLDKNGDVVDGSADAVKPGWDPESNKEIPSYVSLKAGNTTEEVTTKIKVTIIDWFGYTKQVEVPITIKKAVTGE